MFSVVPIGTCRIHIPLSRAQESFDIDVRLARNYGFTHTAREAVQQLRYLHGDFAVPEAVRPILLRSEDEERRIADQRFEEPDLYIVEISSAKLVRVGEVCVQINYLYRHFGEFFSDTERTRAFWRLAGGDDRAALDAWLDEQPTFARLSDDDKALVRSIRLDFADDDDMRAAMTDIIAMTGKDRVAFVTHVNALNAEGQRVESRDRLIRSVEAQAAALGVPVYNPTALMTEFGQSRAMEKAGLDLTHYTDLFADRLLLDWNETILGGVLAVSQDEAATRELLAEHERLLEQGDVFAASRLLRDRLRQPDPNDRLVRALARLEHRLGDHETTVSLYDSLDSGRFFGASDHEALIGSLVELERYDAALRLGERLIGDEAETADIVRASAIAAHRLGDEAKAMTLWKRLFYGGDKVVEAGHAILDLVAGGVSDGDDLRGWAQRVLRRVADHPGAVEKLWELALEARDLPELGRLAALSGKLDDASRLALAQRGADAGLHYSVALLVEHAPAIGPVRQWAVDRLDDWLERGLDALGQRDFAIAAQLVRAVLVLKPANHDAQEGLRSLTAAIRKAAQDALASGDHRGALEFVSAARAADIELEDLHDAAGRAAYNARDFEQAVRLLSDHLTKDDADAFMLRLLARSATKIGDPALAVDAHLALIEHDEADPQQVAESRRQVRSLAGHLLKASRTLTEEGSFEEAHRLLGKAFRADALDGRVERAMKANQRALRLRIKELAPGDHDRRFDYGRLLLSLDPQSEFGARAAAMAALRAKRYEDALAYFERMRPLTENKDQVERNIKKCKLMIERAA
ncbi:hypothetical protein [Sphingomicrobium nitratireducens]|uniref:hypothetical protein n=1 Tax=Sphingomicrobium nitratireducens TaxID=2964666 RepID=UPI00223F14C6|nr:hypothetical protein [Sphingomicrobium nitratireducens]